MLNVDKILELEECIGDCKMCHHARYYEWATDIDDFYCDLDKEEIK